MTQRRVITVAGVLAWLTIGLPVLTRPTDSPLRLGIWLAAFVLFVLAYLGAMRAPRLPLLVMESVSVYVLVITLCNGLEGTLLVLVAMQLGARVGRRVGLSWIAIQTLALAVGIGHHWSPRAALMIVPPYLGFQVLAFFTYEAMTSEVTARRSLALANAELRAVQELLADSGRIAERLRISRELHDALGHRLTAISLNLEAALRRVDGPARGNVETAQTLARELLADVRRIIAERDSRELNLAHALETLIADVPEPLVHLQIAPELQIDDPERGHIVLRCTQEIVTNAARHAHAANLWIVIDRCDDQVRIRAHDDGRGSEAPPNGFGLRSMRERLERAGGALIAGTQPGGGFGIVATLPVRQP